MTAVDPSEPITREVAAAPAGRRSRGRRHAGRTVLLLSIVAAVGLLSTGCTAQEAAETSINKYFTPSFQTCASKIVKRESNYDPAALSADGKNIGLFQINAVHTAWIKTTYGYTFSQLTNGDKNAQVAKGLSTAALSYYGDRWQPWRLDGKPKTDGSCPA